MGVPCGLWCGEERWGKGRVLRGSIRISPFRNTKQADPCVKCGQLRAVHAFPAHGSEPATPLLRLPAPCPLRPPPPRPLPHDMSRREGLVVCPRAPSSHQTTPRRAAPSSAKPADDKKAHPITARRPPHSMHITNEQLSAGPPSILNQLPITVESARGLPGLPSDPCGGAPGQGAGCGACGREARGQVHSLAAGRGVKDSRGRAPPQSPEVRG